MPRRKCKDRLAAVFRASDRPFWLTSPRPSAFFSKQSPRAQADARSDPHKIKTPRPARRPIYLFGYAVKM